MGNDTAQPANAGAQGSTADGAGIVLLDRLCVCPYVSTHALHCRQVRRAYLYLYCKHGHTAYLLFDSHTHSYAYLTFSLTPLFHTTTSYT